MHGSTPQGSQAGPIAAKADLVKFGVEGLTDTPIIRCLLEQLVLHPLHLWLLLFDRSSQISNGCPSLAQSGLLWGTCTRCTSFTTITSTIDSHGPLNGPPFQGILRLKNLLTESAQTRNGYQLSHESWMWYANGHVLWCVSDFGWNSMPDIYGQPFLDVVQEKCLIPCNLSHMGGRH